MVKRLNGKQSPKKTVKTTQAIKSSKALPAARVMKVPQPNRSKTSKAKANAMMEKARGLAAALFSRAKEKAAAHAAAMQEKALFESSLAAVRAKSLLEQARRDAKAIRRKAKADASAQAKHVRAKVYSQSRIHAHSRARMIQSRAKVLAMNRAKVFGTKARARAKAKAGQGALKIRARAHEKAEALLEGALDKLKVQDALHRVKVQKLRAKDRLEQMAHARLEAQGTQYGCVSTTATTSRPGVKSPCAHPSHGERLCIAAPCCAKQQCRHRPLGQLRGPCACPPGSRPGPGLPPQPLPSPPPPLLQPPIPRKPPCTASAPVVQNPPQGLLPPQAHRVPAPRPPPQQGTQSAAQEATDHSGANSACADTEFTKTCPSTPTITSITHSPEPATPVHVDKAPIIRKVSSLMRRNAFADPACEVSTIQSQAPSTRILPQRPQRAVTAPGGSQTLPHALD